MHHFPQHPAHCQCSTRFVEWRWDSWVCFSSHGTRADHVAKVYMQTVALASSPFRSSLQIPIWPVETWAGWLPFVLEKTWVLLHLTSWFEKKKHTSIYDLLQEIFLHMSPWQYMMINWTWAKVIFIKAHWVHFQKLPHNEMYTFLPCL